MRFTNPTLHWIETLYNPFVRLGSNLQSLFLLYIRITWGHQFIMAGMNKLNHIDRTVEIFTTLHLSRPVFLAHLVGYFELIGGLCLFLGFASRLISVPLILIMITALSTTYASSISHLRFLLEPHNLVVQPPYPYLMAVLITFVFGPGRLSVDAWLKRWSEKRHKH